jgi:hypothetical protein
VVTGHMNSAQALPICALYNAAIETEWYYIRFRSGSYAARLSVECSFFLQPTGTSADSVRGYLLKSMR